jgi:hypothetical protein
LHGAVDPCAVATRLCQQDPAMGLRHASHGRRGDPAVRRAGTPDLPCCR